MATFSISQLSQYGDSVRGFITRNVLSRGSGEEKLYTLDDFGKVLDLNDKVLQETSDDLSEEDVKKYDLDPPRVVVVGLTSAGKSSLLERVVGYPLFPVLDRVCTRQPFQLSMKRVTANTSVEPSPEVKEEKEQRRPPAELRFPASGKTFKLPEETEQVRREITVLQQSDSETVTFSKKEIRAVVRSPGSDTFTFTDLPGVFMVSEMKMGSSFAKSRAENARLQDETMKIARHYVQKPNTIVLVVISATDWTHGMNNDPLCGHLCEWLEETRKTHTVEVYGVITKLDMQATLSQNSPIRKVLTGQLSEDHILHGLKVKRWIPVVSSPAILRQADREIAEKMENEAIYKCLRTCIPTSVLKDLPMGRGALLRELKFALLKTIVKTQKGLRERISKFAGDVERKLETLPKPATDTEKRQTFDLRLKVLENTLRNEVDTTGTTSTNSLRMQLLVHAPKKFQRDLQSCSLRGDVQAEVQQILNQSALEAGGSFDSDMSFKVLSDRIIRSYQAPCMNLIESCANIILKALKRAVDKAFGDYKQLKVLVLRTLGLQTGTDVKKGAEILGKLGDAKTPSPDAMFELLRHSAISKVMALLDAHSTMINFHPMWRNFDTLHQKILMNQEKDSKKSSSYLVSSTPPKASAEGTLQEILELPALAARVRNEGYNAINTYEKSAKMAISPVDRAKICKHFARVEVMGYIIRMSLVGSVYPMIIRDLRDGLFKGVQCGLMKFDFSVTRLLRSRLLFDAKVEKKVLTCLDPSSEDMEKRKKWEKKRRVLQDLQNEFEKCQEDLHVLQEIFDS
eukprot:CAMPEP_0114509610 /NCGR_PEP_ID=MMETSP0109-20121206/13306_1 /TAXON_ID=29199 /ORGANISM="Chlorarachnion reptans, Strain CCCM449" /LENGTH=797 /DNA_ID=CAMNT_0001688783 /DNA_START=169 /DNA_END=2562 /DNA_ORIENTATION=+